jgi:hypothetical protein
MFHLYRKITLPDHDWRAAAHNSVTPMTHLFMEMELHLDKSTEEEQHYMVKRSGRTAILINLSHFEPETVQRAFKRNIFTFGKSCIGSIFP